MMKVCQKAFSIEVSWSHVTELWMVTLLFQERGAGAVMSRAKRMRKKLREICLSFLCIFWCARYFLVWNLQKFPIFLFFVSGKDYTCKKILFKLIKCHVTNLQPFWASYLLPAFQNYYIQA